MFSSLYKFLVNIDLKYRSLRELRKPQNIKYIVGIGSLLSGGVGKTPLAIEIASFFLERGYRCGVLLRGYKGKYEQRGAIVLYKNKILLDENKSGDEAQLIGEELKKYPNGIVVIGQEREKALQIMSRLGVEAVVMDDGLFTNNFAYNCKIVCVNGKEKDEKILPVGKLKFPLELINRADLIVYTGDKKSDKWIYRFKKPILKAQYLLEGILTMPNLELKSPSYLKDKKLILVTGIENPDRVPQLLNRYGIKVMEHIIFEDHHSYTEKEVKLIIKRLGDKKLLLTTYKDFVKIKNYLQLQDYQKITVLKVRLNLDMQKLFNFLTPPV